LYYVLLIDFAAISTRVSAFVLICIRMLSEFCLLVIALLMMVLAFSCALSVVKHDDESFDGIVVGAYSLVRILLGSFDASLFANLRKEPMVLAGVFVFVFFSCMFLISLFIAQLSCAYSSVYDDMVGYARLERGTIIVEMMPDVPKGRWYKFAESMQFHKRLEFNPGDVGLSGGIQVREPASANPTTQDSIRRFGGSTSSDMVWPVDDTEDNNSEMDRFDRIEKLMHKALKRVTSTKSGGKSGSGTGGDSAGSDESGGNGDSGSGGSNGSGSDEK